MSCTIAALEAALVDYFRVCRARVFCLSGQCSKLCAARSAQFLPGGTCDVKSGQVPQQLAAQYARLKATPPGNLAGAGVATLLSEMALRARLILAEADRVPLFSPTTGKPYFSFRAAEQSRPVNSDVYADDEIAFEQLLAAFLNGFSGSTPDEIVRATYTIAFSVFAANDVNHVGRKASATFFENLIGHIVARCIGFAPRNKVRTPETGADLPTDYVFDPGEHSRKLHLPIKISTRERIVQAWVHQLVLARIFGDGQYRGVLIVGTETKRDARTGEVIEICIPGQLQVFQTRVTEMSRIYYLDPPQPYLELAHAFPRVEVKPFGEALAELPQLLVAQ
jgi:hypothetical protein